MKSKIEKRTDSLFPSWTGWGLSPTGWTLILKSLFELNRLNILSQPVEITKIDHYSCLIGWTFNSQPVDPYSISWPFFPTNWDLTDHNFWSTKPLPQLSASILIFILNQLNLTQPIEHFFQSVVYSMFEVQPTCWKGKQISWNCTLEE